VVRCVCSKIDDTSGVVRCACSENDDIAWWWYGCDVAHVQKLTIRSMRRIAYVQKLTIRSVRRIANVQKLTIRKGDTYLLGLLCEKFNRRAHKILLMCK
jgi:hypothetical protein